MTALVEWLLGLEHIRLARDAPLFVKWQGHVEAWMLFCAGLVVLTCVVLIYRRERASVPRRVVLACLRCLIATLVIAMFCQPALVLQRNTVEPSYVALMIDTSQSMATKEAYLDMALGAAVATGAGLPSTAALEDHSRLELVQRAFAADHGVAVRTLLKRNGVQMYSFSGAARSDAFTAGQQETQEVDDAIRAALPGGTSTNLAGCLDHVIHAARGRRLAAIVLASDGQSTEGDALHEALDLARGRRIPVFPIRIGSTTAPPDIDVGPISAEESVFVNDILAINVKVRGRGLSAPTVVDVTMIDERTGLPVAADSVTLGPTAEPVTIELRTKPTTPGRTRYRVEVPPLTDERIVSNNSDLVDVDVLDDRLAVLYVEGYPRHEYIYIKNALLREATVRVSVLLLEADQRFVQEGADPIRYFPATPEQLGRFDVVLFGDVDPAGGWLSASQMTMLVDFVGHRGGGFGLIAGERYAPRRYRGTPLEKLLPVRIDPEFLGRYETTLVSGYRPRLTWEGRQSRLFRFATDRTESEAIFAALPELYWVARTLGPKPGASVLLEHPTMRSIDGPMPVAVLGRYGAGKVFFQACDDTWRWRRHTGELLHDTYWLQVVRELMQPQRVGRDRRYALRTDQRRYVYGQSIRVQVEFLDLQLLAQQQDTVSLVVKDDKGATVSRLDAARIAPDSRLYEALYVAPRPGGFEVQAEHISPRPGDKPVSVLLRVGRADLEARRPEADHDTLRRMAEVTGGAVVELDQLVETFDRIHDRSVQIPDDVTEPLWDSKLALALFVLMITMEWVLRKAFGML